MCLFLLPDVLKGDTSVSFLCPHLESVGEEDKELAILHPHRQHLPISAVAHTACRVADAHFVQQFLSRRTEDRKSQKASVKHDSLTTVSISSSTSGFDFSDQQTLIIQMNVTRKTCIQFVFACSDHSRIIRLPLYLHPQIHIMLHSLHLESGNLLIFLLKGNLRKKRANCALHVGVSRSTANFNEERFNALVLECC